MSRKRGMRCFLTRKSDVRRSAQRSRVRPDESQNYSVQNHWKIHQNTENCCTCEVAQKKELQFYPTRSNVIILYNTSPAICNEKVVYMKSSEALCNQVFQCSRLPQKAELKPNLYHGRQDSSDFEARTSVDHQSKEAKGAGETRGDSNGCRGTEEFGEKRSGNIVFRIQVLPHSTVQKNKMTFAEKQSRN